MNRFDSVYTGLITGLLAPFLAVYIYYFSKFPEYGFVAFIQHISKLNLLSPILSLSLVANLALFFIFILLKWDKAARGVLTSTFLYGSIIVTLIFLK